MPSLGGRRAGSSNYTDAEVRNLFGVLREVLPIGPDEWQEALDKHSENYPGRELDSICRKYATSHRKPVPTGDPTCPWLVREAKAIKYLIGQKAELGDGEEMFDIEGGTFTTYTTLDAAADAPPLRQPSQEVTQQTQTADDEPAPLLTPTPTSSSRSSRGSASTASTFAPSVGAPSSAAVRAPKKRIYNRKDSNDDRFFAAMKDSAAAMKDSVDAQREAMNRVSAEAKEDRKMLMNALQACINGAVQAMTAQRGGATAQGGGASSKNSNKRKRPELDSSSSDSDTEF